MGFFFPGDFFLQHIKHLLFFDSERNVQENNLNEIVGHRNCGNQEVVVPKKIFLSFQVTVFKSGNISIHFFNLG